MDIKARATACALAGGLMLGSGIGLALGGAYWMGERAQSQVAHARAERLAEAAALGFSQHALQAEMTAMGPSAAALAQRQDPFGGEGLRGRQGAEVITRFDAHAQGSAQGSAPGGAPAITVLPASLNRHGPAAQPFHFADNGALQSARDLACLTEAVYYEARGEGSAGQAAVAQVVLNRVRHPAFPKSVCGVVFQRAGGEGCQFSFVCDGSMRHQHEQGAWSRAEEIAARALDGAVMASIGNATHFHNAGINPGWGPGMLRVAQVGLHVFYRFGGHAGGSGAFNGQAEHSAPTTGTVSADGAPTGQYILASATTLAPQGQAAAAPVASTAAKPAAAVTPKAKDGASDKAESPPKPAPAETVATVRPAQAS
jgi:spore germination cell wall hydrolase CwlJ-like protein